MRERTGNVTDTVAPAATEAISSVTAATSQADLDALLCDILPRQGCWSDEAYLWLTDHSRRRIEFTDGRIEELPVPTYTHQAVLAFLYRLFHDYLRPRGGVAMFSGLRMRIRKGKFREPDLLMLCERSDHPQPGPPLAGRGPGGRSGQPGRPRTGIWWRSAPTTPRRASPSTGSPIPATRRSPCSPWMVRRTSRPAPYERGSPRHVAAARRIHRRRLRGVRRPGIGRVGRARLPRYTTRCSRRRATSVSE